MELSDIEPKNFFKKVTFIGDSDGAGKKQIPLEDFLLISILLKIEDTLRKK